MESILLSPFCGHYNDLLTATCRLEPYPNPYSRSFRSEIHIRSSHFPVLKLEMLSFTYMVKAKPLSTVQKVLPRLTPPSSNLICWIPSAHPPWTHHTVCTLFFASIFFVPRELLLILQEPIQTSPPFQSISWLPPLQAKQVVTLQLPLYYVSLLHLLHFVYCFVLFLLGSPAWMSLFFSKILWTLNEHRLYVILVFIPSTYHHTWYVTETWETLCIFLNFLLQYFMGSYSYSDTLAETTMATYRLCYNDSTQLNCHFLFSFRLSMPLGT